jgi:hypothetical protein
MATRARRPPAGPDPKSPGFRIYKRTENRMDWFRFRNKVSQWIDINVHFMSEIFIWIDFWIGLPSINMHKVYIYSEMHVY